MNDPEGAFEHHVLPALGETLGFLRLIWAVDHALHAVSKRMAASVGVTGPQRLVIRIVGRFPGMTAGQLAELLQVHPSTLSGVLKRLERRGLIHRRVDQKDARRAFLGLTKKGHQFDVATEGTVEAAVEAVLSGTSKEQLDATRCTFMLLVQKLGNSVRDARER